LEADITLCVMLSQADVHCV